MKIRSVAHDNRRKGFEIRTSRAKLWFPYGKLELRPTPRNPVVREHVDPELGSEGFAYLLKSGEEGTVHIEQVLEYNQDPGYLRDLILYKLTIEARNRLSRSALSRREIIRRQGTSPAQFYRLIDQTNYRKSVDQVLSLLHVLDCEVDLVVRAKSA